MIRPSELHAQIPADHVAHARSAAAILGEEIYTKFYFAPGTNPMGEDPIDLVLNRSWRPQLAITGIEGLPTPANAGNVLLPYTNAKVSLRLPPSLNAAKAADFLRELSRRIRPMGPKCVLRPWNPAQDGVRLLSHHGLSDRLQQLLKPYSDFPPSTWVKAVAFHLWTCWGSASPMHNSW